MPDARPVAVVGRFPPPLDGQTLATDRLAELVGASRPVVRVSTSAPEGDALVSTEARWGWRRAGHYLATGRRLRRALAAAPEAPALWASISPHPLGHARDVLTTLPAFGPTRPVVAVVHRAYFDRMFAGPTRWTARRVVARCAAVVFLTDGLADRAAPFVPAEKRVVIPNTVGADVLCTAAEVEAARTARAARPGLRLLFLGNLMPEKGYDLALETAARLAAAHDVRLDLVGRWPSPDAEAAFAGRVEALGLAGRVVAHGGVPHAAIKRFVLDADLLLFPSTHPSEALPVAVLEALGAGTPVVGVAHAALPEVVRDGAGVLVPPDAEALAAAVTSLASPEVWLGASRAARARFDAAYAPEAVRARWLALLARVER
ncbi:glycosyltransferase family 4 protein [Rubrivirga sp. IMCC45206]|uniref:glycosyltransferase family 4 protein n=1 Tax=Rubrivirga sp. IMCC45206 TaxID=3391614 RepID=UPI0039901943